MTWFVHYAGYCKNKLHFVYVDLQCSVWTFKSAFHPIKLLQIFKYFSCKPAAGTQQSKYCETSVSIMRHLSVYLFKAFKLHSTLKMHSMLSSWIMQPHCCFHFCMCITVCTPPSGNGNDLKMNKWPPSPTTPFRHWMIIDF